MAEFTIHITGIAADGCLILSDGGDTVASQGDTVTWTIDPNSGVSSITAIHDNVTLDIFSPDPQQVEGLTDWSGQINKNLNTIHTIPCEEPYTIWYTKTPGGTEYRSDPKIQVNS